MAITMIEACSHKIQVVLHKMKLPLLILLSLFKSNANSSFLFIKLKKKTHISWKTNVLIEAQKINCYKFDHLYLHIDILSVN